MPDRINLSYTRLPLFLGTAPKHLNSSTSSKPLLSDLKLYFLLLLNFPPNIVDLALLAFTVDCLPSQ